MKRARPAGIVAVLMMLTAAGCASDTAAPTAPTTTSSSTTIDTTTTSTPPASSSTTTSSTTTTGPTTTTTVPLDPLLGVALETVATGFSRPTFVTAPPGDPRLFVLEAVGRVLVVDPDGTVLPEPFLNIRNKVGSVSIEQGLLGLAFHPGYAANGRIYVYYTDRTGDSVVAEYAVGEDPNQVDVATERIVLTIEQPHERHNAGMLQFGPEGALYISTGDGGAGGASVHGQDPSTLLAAILRIDVDGRTPYAVPPDNPFVDGGGAPEVWAFGLRNPWRFAIDTVDQTMYVADVGQDSREEINAVALAPTGYNFGWPAIEGSACFFERGCDPSDYTLPVLEYTHDDGLSVTGGYVYRGSDIPEIAGHYFYADWVREWIRSFRLAAGAVTDERDWTAELRPGQVNSFGVDGRGELLVATWDGLIGRIVPVR